jgi:hypothetical protein
MLQKSHNGGRRVKRGNDSVFTAIALFLIDRSPRRSVSGRHVELRSAIRAKQSAIAV